MRNPRSSTRRLRRRSRFGTCCSTTASRTTRATAWWCTRRSGNTIAFGEAIFGYNGLGWRLHGRGARRHRDRACGAHRAANDPLDRGRSHRGPVPFSDGLNFVASRTPRLPRVLRDRVVRRIDLVDRDQVRERMHIACRGPHRRDAVGPRLGVRWWRFGVVCCSDWPVRQSGPDVLRRVLRVGVRYRCLSAVLGAAAMGGHAAPRRRADRIRARAHPVWGGRPLCAVVRVGDRVNRHEVGQSIGPGGFLPDAIRSLWHYTYAAYRFHSGLTMLTGTITRGNPSHGRGRCRCAPCCM